MNRPLRPTGPPARRSHLPRWASRSRGGSGSGANRIAIIVALIGAGGVVVAAIVTGLFGLFQSDMTGSSGPPARAGGAVFAITSVSYPEINGKTVIEVTGTVRDLAAGDQVYAFAAAQADARPWFPGGPAQVGGNGIWTARIIGTPAGSSHYAVWAGIAAPPPPTTVSACATCTTSPPPPTLSPPEVRREIASHGPHAAVLIGVTHPFRGG